MCPKITNVKSRYIWDEFGGKVTRQCFAYRPSVVHQLCLIQAKREVCERHEGRSQLFDDKRIDSKSLTTPFVDQG